ncbi:hypothetical protein T040910_231 [Synechococcus phage S-CAM3]|uniref:Uncharacterized protein n=1 Tax=Synechococcus phage S-CAM3 TaxID=1883366 RepID=A0A1D8KJY8_9CAUD|nr:hypothetical protein BOW87_gp026 [Synechococcus phage S-CAM3]AOV58736.1 hypothetical protein S250808_231 [Synechococcus phage S-CAM3]AOV58975.1 hypothetical protein T040910_231 [Synechococcus phage S-CAM3]AOV59215.1 hypothetical protein C421010_232 [Synechococcus phage S-CAM3]
MDKDKLKLIYKNLKSLLNALESEIYSDPAAYKEDSKLSAASARYDSQDDDDGYTD